MNLLVHIKVQKESTAGMEVSRVAFFSSFFCFTYPLHPKAHFATQWQDDLQQLQVTYYQLSSIKAKRMSPFQ